ncbi:MAG: LPS-assembly protein LptD [Bacteroidales bacterium]|jgi:hypothetical protein|nr:LPS-assembly protein LptD [Bacteroidales bacterium]
MFKPLLFSIIVGLIFFFYSCNPSVKTRSTIPNIDKNNEFYSDQAIIDTLKNNLIETKDSIFPEKNIVTINATVTTQDSVVDEYDYARLYNYEIFDTIEISSQMYEDSIPVVDTIGDLPAKKKSGMEFDYPVYYTSDDKGFLDFANQKAYLYGNAVVKYENITLTSDYMEMDFEKNEVFSHGITDSLGKVTGKPVFEEGSETFQADTIRYNFKSKRGIVKNVTTEFEGSYLHGGKTKLHENRHVHMIDGKFTTCDDIDHPHFYFKITKAKVIPDDKIISGPAYLVLEDVPTPLGIPFAFFPNTKGGSSGILIPSFGDDPSRGFFLQDAGYYWLINDYVDLTFLGSIFTKGSWSAGLKSNYKVRYKFDGFLAFNYSENVFGYKGLSNYRKEQMYSFIWKFNQDQKARPNSRFSADVNMSSANYDKNNSTNINNILTTNKQSSISYTKQFANSPFNLSANIGHYQNNQTKEVSLTLPNLNFSMSTIYPLKRKTKTGETRWYEKIGMAYTMRLENTIKTTDSTLFDIGFNDMNNGISHSIPIKTSFSFLKYTTLSPSFTYNERWYLKTMEKYWQEDPTDATGYSGKVIQNYVPGFAREWDYNASLDWTTTLYGTFNFKGNGKVKALRHMLTPSVRFSFHPDFEKERYKFYDQYYNVKYYPELNQYDTTYNYYSRFEGLPFSRTPRGGSGTVNFSLANNLEMKLRNKNDTATTDQKVKILESFNITTSYNIFADSLNWAPLNVTGRTKISFINLDFGAIFNPYAYVINENGNHITVNEFLYKIDTARWRVARLTSANISVSLSLNKNASPSKVQYDPYQSLYGYPYEYADFSIPWNISIRYSLIYSKTSINPAITQTVNVSGSFNLTEKWKIDINTGYDIKMKKITTSSINIYRDLHCWEASLHVVPFGNYRSYKFQINVKSAMLQDLKLKKERSIYNNTY